MSERIYKMRIGAHAVAGKRGMDVINPATGAAFVRAPDCTAEELDEAVAAARAAFPVWSATPLAERQRVVAELAAVIAGNMEELKQVFTREQGKPLAFAEMELGAAAYWCQGAATLAPERRVLEDAPERRVEVVRAAVGVVACIIPWNFPVLLAFQKLAPAMVAGCTVVLKPSPYTPLTMLRIAELIGDKIPPGVLNVVTGGDPLGPILTAHPGIDKISFTGSTATGKKVMAGAAHDLKRVTLELGGNDPAIVMPDVDIRSVAQKLFWAAFVNSGQLCLATKRLYVHSDVYEPLTKAMIEVARTVTVGDGAVETTGLGPIQNRVQYERVQALIADARRDGLTFLYEGDAPKGQGYFVPVTIIGDPPEDSAVVTKEAFGPVLPVMRFSDVDEVIARANRSEYGLGASVWSRDEKQAQAIAARLDAGVVWINDIHYMSPFTALAGRKQSGIGAENGIEGFNEFTAIKTLIMSHAHAA